MSYRRLKNLGDYSNEAIEVEGIVFGSEDAAVVLDELRNWVFSQLGIARADIERRERVLRVLDDQIFTYEQQRDSLRANIEAMRTWAAEHGTRFMAELGDPLPF